MPVHTITASIAGGRLVGTVSVRAGRNRARTASVPFFPARGDGYSALALIGQTMAISVDGGTIFNGWIDDASIDGSSGLITLQCTDGLQDAVDNLSETELLALITGGQYHSAVFGERTSGWEQAQDILETVPGSIQKNTAGTVQFQRWDAPVGSVGVTNATMIEATAAPKFGNRRGIINRIQITFEYRFTRLHHREHTFSWTWNSSFCVWSPDPFTLPSRDMVQSAADGAGWTLQGPIVYETLPEPGYYCGGVGWAPNPELLKIVVTSAGWTAVKRWSQTVTETYNLTVEDSGSVGRYGALPAEDGVGYTTEYDDQSWDASIDSATPSGFTVDAIGDYVQDQDEATVRADIMNTLVAMAQTRIQASHRHNEWTATIELTAGLNIGAAGSVGGKFGTGSGTVDAFEHRFEVATGKASTTVTIVGTSGGGGSTGAVELPAPPDTAPAHAAQPSHTALPTRIGNDAGAPNYDEDWEGYTGNYQLIHGFPLPSKFYEDRFRVVTQDIESESRDEATGSADETYTASSTNQAMTAIANPNLP